MEHVKRGTADMPAIKPDLESRLINQATARAVDNPNARLGFGKVFSRQDIARLIGQWCMQRDEIGLGEECIKISLFNAHFNRALRREERIISNHLHAQAKRAACDDCANIARADQAERLARDLNSHETVLFPFAGLGRKISLRQLARKRKHQRYGMFRRGDRIAERCVHDDHTLGRRCGDINIINADASAANHFEIGCSIKDRLGHLG